MLIYNNFRQEFYEVVRRAHTLVIVNADVDALCASVILSYAFSCDIVTFSLSAVDTWQDIQKAVEEHKDRVRNVVLINCGASRSLLDLNLPSNVNIFVLDSHRPVHLDNIYSGEVAIKVLVPQVDVAEMNVPEPSAVYDEQDSSDEEVDEEEEEDGENSNRQGRHETLAERIERRTLKKQRKTAWKRNRAQLIWNYYVRSWYSAASSVFMLELLHDLGKPCAEMMWCAAVGLTSQFIDQLVSVEAYTNVCIDRMRPFIRKFAPRKSIEQTRREGVLKITFDKELTLPLYAHWTAYESMRCDSMFVCQSKLWSQGGESSLKFILAGLGLTLAECKQNFTSLNGERRQQVFETLEKYMDSSFGTFSAFLSYSTCYNAADFARILALRLECKTATSIGRRKRSCYERFSAAKTVLQDFLKYGDRATPDLERMISGYKVMLKELTALVFSSVNQRQIVFTHRYMMLNLQQSPHVGFLTSRHCLHLFTHLLLRTYASRGSAGRASRPLLVSVPLAEDASKYIVIGLMPLAEILSDVQRKNVLGRAFEHVAEEAKIVVERENFDSNIILLKADDRVKFFNSLEARLEIN